MARKKLPDEKRLVLQALRISPDVREILSSLPTAEKKLVIAEARKAVERIVIAMTARDLAASSQNN